MFAGCNTLENQTPESNILSPMSVMTTWGSTTIVDNGTDKYLEKEISASVFPVKASQTVFYSVEWSADATLKDEPVDDYIKIFQDVDGSVDAKVRCYKDFGNDVIKLFVTSTVNEDVSSFCMVKYEGLATNIEISDSTIMNNDISSFLRYSEERGDYYELVQGSDFYFDVNLTNLLGVKDYHLEFSLSYVGSLWFGDFWDCQLLELSSLASDLDSKFGYGAPDTEEYQLYLTSSFYIENFEKNSLLFASLQNGSGSEEWEQAAAENLVLLDSCYYVFTITDTCSGLSTFFKFWVEPVPTSVNFDSNELLF